MTPCIHDAVHQSTHHVGSGAETDFVRIMRHGNAVSAFPGNKRVTASPFSSPLKPRQRLVDPAGRRRGKLVPDGICTPLPAPSARRTELYIPKGTAPALANEIDARGLRLNVGGYKFRKSPVELQQRRGSGGAAVTEG
jgi:hypothetical protein